MARTSDAAFGVGLQLEDGTSVLTRVMKRVVPILFVLFALVAPLHGEPRHLGEPANLSPAARRVIRERMERHGQDMEDLVWSVLLLDYANAARAASAMAAGARPLDRNAPELEHLVYLFEMQDELRARALTLAEAASKRDPTAMEAAFKQVSETCVKCHVMYLSSPRPAKR